MRTGISIKLKPNDRRRLAALARDRNARHKRVWRAEIVLSTADGVNRRAKLHAERQHIPRLRQTSALSGIG